MTPGETEKYATYMHDGRTDLAYADQRYYATGAGRFMTADPAGDGLNWYAYVGGDPVNGSDPRELSVAGTIDESGQFVPSAVPSGTIINPDAQPGAEYNCGNRIPIPMSIEEMQANIGSFTPRFSPPPTLDPFPSISDIPYSQSAASLTGSIPASVWSYCRNAQCVVI